MNIAGSSRDNRSQSPDARPSSAKKVKLFGQSLSYNTSLKSYQWTDPDPTHKASEENSNINIAGSSHPLNPNDQEKLEKFINNPIKEFFDFEFEENQDYAKGFTSVRSWNRVAGLSDNYYNRIKSGKHGVGLTGFILLIAAYQTQRNLPQQIAVIKDRLKDIPMDKDFLNALKNAKEKFLQKNKNIRFSETYEKNFIYIKDMIKKGKNLSLQEIVTI